MDVVVVLVALFMPVALLVFVRWDQDRLFRGARSGAPASSVKSLALGSALMAALFLGVAAVVARAGRQIG